MFSIISTQALLLLVDCKNKILTGGPNYQRLISVANEKLDPSDEHNIEIKQPKVKQLISFNKYAVYNYTTLPLGWN